IPARALPAEERRRWRKALQTRHPRRFLWHARSGALRKVTRRAGPASSTGARRLARPALASALVQPGWQPVAAAPPSAGTAGHARWVFDGRSRHAGSIAGAALLVVVG